MKLYITGKNASQGLEAGDSTSFKHVAQSLGYTIVSKHLDADAAICVDFHPKFREELRDAQNNGVRTFLIQQEPYVVLPEHRKRNPGQVFDHVLRIGIPGEVTRHYGNSWNLATNWKDQRQQRFVAITANKWSALPGQLYSLRREIYSSHELIDLYGHGWEASVQSQLLMLTKEVLLGLAARSRIVLPKASDIFSYPSNYLGSVKDKAKTMANYDFSLVIENSGHYMSEKLMDSLLSGNIPVYVGAASQHFNIPEQFVFQAEPSVDSIRDKINDAMFVNPIEFRSTLKEWLLDPQTLDAWKADRVTTKLLAEISRLSTN